MKLLWGLLFIPCVIQASWWQNSQQKGQSLFDQGQYIAAAEAFEDRYRQGVALYRAGHYAKAIVAFKQNQRDAVSIDALYNLANSYFQQKNYTQAYRTYRQLLTQFPAHQLGQYNHALTKAMLAQLDPQSLLELEQEPPDQQDQDTPEDADDTADDVPEQDHSAEPSAIEKPEQNETEEGQDTLPSDQSQNTPKPTIGLGGGKSMSGSASNASSPSNHKDQGKEKIQKKGMEANHSPNQSMTEQGQTMQLQPQDGSQRKEETSNQDASPSESIEKQVRPWLQQIEAQRIHLLRYQFEQKARQQQGTQQEIRPW